MYLLTQVDEVPEGALNRERRTKWSRSAYILKEEVLDNHIKVHDWMKASWTVALFF